MKLLRLGETTFTGSKIRKLLLSFAAAIWGNATGVCFGDFLGRACSQTSLLPSQGAFPSPPSPRPPRTPPSQEAERGPDSGRAGPAHLLCCLPAELTWMSRALPAMSWNPTRLHGHVPQAWGSGRRSSPVQAPGEVSPPQGTGVKGTWDFLSACWSFRRL